jgi:hypothetical protein
MAATGRGHARTPATVTSLSQKLASVMNAWNVLEAARCLRKAPRILWRSSGGIWSGGTSGSGSTSIISGLEAASCIASTSSIRLRATDSSSNPLSRLSRGNHTLSFWALGCEVSNGTSRASRARSVLGPEVPLHTVKSTLEVRTLVSRVAAYAHHAHALPLEERLIAYGCERSSLPRRSASCARSSTESPEKRSSTSASCSGSASSNNRRPSPVK